MLEKANMLLLTKEASDKDCSLKSLTSHATDSQKNDFNIEKKDFPENALCYINQGHLSTVENDKLAIYNHNFILGQLIVAANQPKNID